MFGKLTQKLRYIAASAVVAMAGLFATAEQAEAAKIDKDKGTITVQSGDSLSKIVLKLAKLDIQTTPEKIQDANADLIKNVDTIKVGQVFVIPKTIENVVMVAATTAEAPAAEPCDDKSKLEYWAQEVEAEHADLTADVKALMAQEKLEAFQEGQKCETCAPEQAAVVAPQGLTSSPVPKAKPVVAAAPAATPPAATNTYEVKSGDGLCDVVRAENKSFDGIVAHNPALGAPYELSAGQTLDLTDVGELNKKEDKLYKDYCTGTRRIVHKPVQTVNTPSVSTPVVTMPKQCELVKSGNRLYSIPLAKKFEERCGCADQPFSRVKLVMENGKIVIKTVWGNPKNQCDTGGDHEATPRTPPVEPPPVDPPTGGCKEHCGTDGGGGSPNPDVDGENGGGDHNPPGPGDNNGGETGGGTGETNHEGTENPGGGETEHPSEGTGETDHPTGGTETPERSEKVTMVRTPSALGFNIA